MIVMLRSGIIFSWTFYGHDAEPSRETTRCMTVNGFNGMNALELARRDFVFLNEAPRSFNDVLQPLETFLYRNLSEMRDIRDEMSLSDGERGGLLGAAERRFTALHDTLDVLGVTPGYHDLHTLLLDIILPSWARFLRIRNEHDDAFINTFGFDPRGDSALAHARREADGGGRWAELGFVLPFPTERSRAGGRRRTLVGRRRHSLRLVRKDGGGGGGGGGPALAPARRDGDLDEDESDGDWARSDASDDAVVADTVPEEDEGLEYTLKL